MLSCEGLTALAVLLRRRQQGLFYCREKCIVITWEFCIPLWGLDTNLLEWCHLLRIPITLSTWLASLLLQVYQLGDKGSKSLSILQSLTFLMGAAVDANTQKYVEYSGICLRVGTGAHLFCSTRTHDQKCDLKCALINDLVKPQLSNGHQEPNVPLICSS